MWKSLVQMFLSLHLWKTTPETVLGVKNIECYFVLHSFTLYYQKVTHVPCFSYL